MATVVGWGFTEYDPFGFNQQEGTNTEQVPRFCGGLWPRPFFLVVLVFAEYFSKLFSLAHQ